MMPKPPPAAATKQSCLQRLQSLQQQFLYIDSPAELADAEREGGHILAQLLHYQHIGPDTLLLNATDLLLDYAAGALDTRADNGLPTMGRNLAEHYQQTLWTFLAMGASDQQRVIMHPAGPGTSWTITHTKGTTTTKQPTDAGVQVLATDRARDYRQQGKRYALFTAELIARMQAATAEQPNGSPDAKGKRGYTPKELAIAIGGVIADGSPGWTAIAVADEIKRLNPDRTVGSTTVGKHPVFQAYLNEQRKRRAGRNTGKPKTITTSGDMLDNLLNPTGRKTKRQNPDDRDDDY
jgi:hypothetical protein